MFTLLGMLALAKLGWFEIKQIPQSKLAQLAAAYVGYIVLCNLSLKVNTVGFYQASAPPSPWVVRGSQLSCVWGREHAPDCGPCQTRHEQGTYVSYVRRIAL
jgi:hypothetical protein